MKRIFFWACFVIIFQDLRPEHLYAQTKDPRAEFFLVTFPVN